MLKREIYTTKDGSKTIYIPEWNEHYHSKHGALQEAEHVFIKNGLNLLAQKPEVKILEFGFGTGLNALITALLAKRKIEYHSLERYPMTLEEANALDYPSVFAEYFNKEQSGIEELFQKIHSVEWGSLEEINTEFKLKKIEADFKTVNLPKNYFDIIYFDAFGKRVQPELWSVEIFFNIYNSLIKGGLFTTYACNGDTKRALKEVGFEVEKKAGPPGKREMLNAWKS